MRFPYHASLAPPAPFLPVRVSNLTGGPEEPSLPVITFSEDYALLGRDVLNRLRLLLDGPALALEILPQE